jgi:uncharacterized protein with HEPN domain
VAASERIRQVIGQTTETAFEADWQQQWLVERGIEIISEASRHLPEPLKSRHPEIPWRKVADIGNILRHAYEHTASALLWKLVQHDLAKLEQVCRDELGR